MNWLYYVVLPAGFGVLSILLHPHSARFSTPELEAYELTIHQAILLEPIWVDARSIDARERGSIPDSIPLNEDLFDQQLVLLLEQWSPGSKVVVYCDSDLCDASNAIRERLLNEVGLYEVYILHGGWQSWKTYSKR